MSHGTYLDCGCYIDEAGHRAFCPSCDASYTLRGRISKDIKHTCEEYTDEICRLKLKIDDLEEEVQDLKAVRRWLAGIIKDFAIPHMALDCEQTPADQYDELMRDYTVACHAIVDAYQALDIDAILAGGKGEDRG